MRATRTFAGRRPVAERPLTGSVPSFPKIIDILPTPPDVGSCVTAIDGRRELGLSTTSTFMGRVLVTFDPATTALIAPRAAVGSGFVGCTVTSTFPKVASGATGADGVKVHATSGPGAHVTPSPGCTAFRPIAAPIC